MIFYTVIFSLVHNIIINLTILNMNSIKQKECIIFFAIKISSPYDIVNFGMFVDLLLLEYKVQNTSIRILFRYFFFCIS